MIDCIVVAIAVFAYIDSIADGIVEVLKRSKNK